MKQFIIISLLLFATLSLMANPSHQEMLNAYEQLQDQLMSSNYRIDYTYYITVFLPPTLSAVTFANELKYQELIHYNWEEEWVETSVMEHTYSNNLLVEYLMIMDDYSFKYVITYDGEGRLYQSVMSMDMGSGFTDFMRETFEYNANGVLNNYFTEYWQPTREWINGYQWIITLSGDQITTIIGQNWDSAAWENVDRTNLTWDGDIITENFREEWVDGSWVNERLRGYTYAGSSVVEIFEQTWNSSNWENSQFIELTWQADWIIHQLYQEWDGSDWINSKDYTTTYENDKPVENLTLDWTGSEWVNFTKIVYVYSAGTSQNCIPTTQIHLNNYPNPFNPSTTIAFSIKEGETGLLTIFNTKGQVLVTEEFNSEEHNYYWNANSYSSGIYLYKLQTESFSQTKKMILLK